MFGLGMPEILLILAIALMVIGPKKLPDLAKTLGRALGEFKKAAQDFKNSIDMEDSVKEFNDPLKSIKNDLKDTLNPLKTSSGSDDVKKESVLSKGIEKDSMQNNDFSGEKLAKSKSHSNLNSHSHDNVNPVDADFEEDKIGKGDDNLIEDGKVDK